MSIVRDEVDIIAQQLRHVAAQGVDGILVVDRMSTDGTEVILDEIDLPCRLVIEQWYEDAWWQGRRMTEACNQAVELGAEWIIPFDADELFYHPDGRPLADVLAAAPGDAVGARLTHHFCTGQDLPRMQRIDAEHSVERTPFETMQFRKREASNLPKSIVRWRRGMVMWEGNHGVAGVANRPLDLGIEVRHFPYRSEEQTIRKIVSGSRALALTTLPSYVGEHWRAMGAAYDEHGEDAIRAWYREGLYYLNPYDDAAGLVFDPARIDT